MARGSQTDARAHAWRSARVPTHPAYFGASKIGAVLREGATMKSQKQGYGLSNGGPIRAALLEHRLLRGNAS